MNGVTTRFLNHSRLRKFNFDSDFSIGKTSHEITVFILPIFIDKIIPSHRRE